MEVILFESCWLNISFMKELSNDDVVYLLDHDDVLLTWLQAVSYSYCISHFNDNDNWQQYDKQNPNIFWKLIINMYVECIG